MSFNVKRADIDAVGYWIASYSSEVSKQLGQVKSAAERMAALDSFQGATAENVKAYWGEMHVSTIVALLSALSEISMRYAEYAEGYSNLDSARDARFEEETLARTYAQFSSSRSDIAGKARSLSSVISPVSDLIGGWTPSYTAVDGLLAELADVSRDLRLKVDAYESTHLAASLSCDELTNVCRSMVASLGSGGGAVSYTPGAIANQAWAPALEAAFAASASYREGAQRSRVQSMLPSALPSSKSAILMQCQK